MMVIVVAMVNVVVAQNRGLMPPFASGNPSYVSIPQPANCLPSSTLPYLKCLIYLKNYAALAENEPRHIYGNVVLFVLNRVAVYELMLGEALLMDELIGLPCVPVVGIRSFRYSST